MTRSATANPLASHSLLKGAPYEVINTPTKGNLREYFDKRVRTGNLRRAGSVFIILVSILRVATQPSAISLGKSLDVIIMVVLGVSGIVIFTKMVSTFDVPDTVIEEIIEEHEMWKKSTQPPAPAPVS